MASSVQSVEERPDIDLGPAIVVALNDTDSLCERQSRSNEDGATHRAAIESSEGEVVEGE